MLARGFIEGDHLWGTVEANRIFRLRYGKALVEKDRKSGSIPVYGTNGRCGWNDVPLFRGPGVILGRKGQGPLGVEWCAGDYWVIDTGYTLELLTDSLELKYAYYMIKFVGLNHLKDGTSNPTLSRDSFGSQSFPIPPMHMQREIVSALESLDDKIALLRETNATLEAIAQALFKSWFVDYDPVRAKAEGRDPEGVPPELADLFPSEFEDSGMGAIPKGWARSSLGDMTEVGIGKTPPRKQPNWFSTDSNDVVWVSIKDMGQSGVYISDSAEYLTQEAVDRFNVRVIPSNAVLLSFKMTLGRLCISDGPMCTNEAIAHCKVPEGESLTPEYVYCSLRAFNFSTLSSTSSIADAVNSKSVRAIPMLRPSHDILEAFSTLVSPIFRGIKLRQDEIQNLTELRDTLLPRLMSGKLRICGGTTCQTQ